MEDNIDWLFDDPLPTVVFKNSGAHLKAEVKHEPGCEDQLQYYTGVKDETTLKKEVEVKVKREDQVGEVHNLCLSSGAGVVKCGRPEGSSEGDWTTTEEKEYKRRMQGQHNLLSHDDVGRLAQHGLGGVGFLGPAHREQCMERVCAYPQDPAVDRPASCGTGAGCPLVKVEGGGGSVRLKKEEEKSHEEMEYTLQPQVYIEVKTESCEETGVERLGEGEEQKVEEDVHWQTRAQSSVATGVSSSVGGAQWSEGSSAPAANSSSSEVSEPGPCVSSVGTAQLSLWEKMEEKHPSHPWLPVSGKGGRVQTPGSDVPQEAWEAASPHPDVQTAHSSVERYACPHCDKTFLLKTSLQRHLNTHDKGVRKYLCPHCQFAAQHRQDLQRHIESVHRDVRTHPCPPWRHTFVEENSRQAHVAEVHGNVKKRACPHCQYRNIRQSVLNRHIRTVHEGIKKHCCPHCQYKAARKDHLQSHIETVHEGIWKYSCSKCQYKTAIKKSFQRHIETVHEKIKKHFCPHCQYKTAQKTDLQIHTEAVHEGIRKHSCPHCQYKTARKDHFQRHIKTVHEKIKKHFCPHCQYKTAHKTDLQIHTETVHEGIWKHSCPHCQYKTAKKADLKKHIEAVHEEMRKHSCPHCQHRTAYKCSLQRHVKTFHEGKKD